MKNLVFKKIWSGVLYGSAMFTLSLLLIDCVFDSSLSVLPHQYARIIIGAICIGIGFVLSSLVYEEDRLPFFIRTLWQLLICIVTILIAFFISGGIPKETGFGTGGATVEDIKLFKEHVGPNVKIKAAGGIGSIADAEKFMALGADRLGTSRIVKIVKGEIV